VLEEHPWSRSRLSPRKFARKVVAPSLTSAARNSPTIAVDRMDATALVALFVKPKIQAFFLLNARIIRA
jgi:hypothetical protein